MERKKTIMEVQIISRETIKPSSPTPQHLRNFKLSLLDQINPLVYVPIVFFYPPTKEANEEKNQNSKRIFDILKKSLPETLTRFYPLAGRIKDSFSIDCNDEGVDYVEAQANVDLFEVLRQPEIDALNRFLPCEIGITESDNNVVHQLAIQVNRFDSGGFAIGFCFLHMIMDGSSLTAFVNDWANMARGSSDHDDEAVGPIFVQDSFFPSRDLSGFTPTAKVSKVESTTSRTRRFVFDGSTIAALKAKVCLNHKDPTRVEAVSMLIWQRIMAAESKAKPGSRNLSVANLAVNIRRRMVLPLQENSIGSIFWHASVSSSSTVESELDELVGQMRESVRKVDLDHVKKLQGDEGFLRVCEAMKKLGEFYSADDVDCYTFTSWCRFPLYEADFGWGKPAWVSSVDSAAEGIKNVVIMMDTGLGEGIEAWVTSDERVMAELQRDKELLDFASFNPSVLHQLSNSEALNLE